MGKSGKSMALPAPQDLPRKPEGASKTLSMTHLRNQRTDDSTVRRFSTVASQDRDEESEDSDDEDGGHLGEACGSIDPDSQQVMKREKRLAMNRASARERRRRKRVLLEKLEERVLELSKQVQTLQDVNEGLQNHIGKIEAELASSRAIIATYTGANSSAAGAGTSLAGTAGHTSVSASLSNIDQEARLQSILLGTKRGSEFSADFCSRPTTGTLHNILAERQILLDLQAHQRRRSLLQQANAATDALAAVAGLRNSGSLGAASRTSLQGGGATCSTLPLLGRMNYLNALTENTLASRQSRGLGLRDGESKVDTALAFTRTHELHGMMGEMSTLGRRSSGENQVSSKGLLGGKRTLDDGGADIRKVFTLRSKKFRAYK